ncbi:MAG: UDP-glucose/GDP-mannose dehydrogenase family protein [Bdellovibrionales bacterium]|nr:UDP-glucose/GDP-mannose dehydrogenase family protein [Bdellovibrionales bacterium]
MRICVVGTGYVGLVAGACFSDVGNHVSCLDIDQNKIERLNRGEVPIFEPGLDEIVERNTKAGRLHFTSDPADAIGRSRVIFLAVGTPSSPDGDLDLKYVLSAAESVRDNLKEEAFVVLKSTVPVGTADKVRAILKTGRFKTEVISNPEFLKEGTAINDFLRPERVVIGCESEAGKRVMNELYAPFLRSGNPIFFMGNRSAELAKYAANAFLATKISFINDLALLAEKTGGDIHDIRRVLVTDSRIGHKFLYPGCGYGGSCFPKDVKAIIKLGEHVDHPLQIFAAAHQVNEKQKRVILDKIKKHYHSKLEGKTFAIWGTAFKPMTDDMREAPAVTLIEGLLAAGASVRAYDPVAADEARKLFGDTVTVCSDAYEAAHKADGLAIMTEWNEFRSPDFEMLKAELNQPVIFDGRNLYNPEGMQYNGITYYCIGTPDPS